MNRRPRRFLIVLLAITVLVVAPTGALARKPAGSGSTAAASVFVPNPVASSGNQGLLDSKDADSAALNSQQVVVDLTNLDGAGT